MPSSSPSIPEEESVGPVTKLALLAAAQSIQASQEARAKEHTAIQATAVMVGETALALAARRNSMRSTTSETMSVAARARAAADLPLQPIRIPTSCATPKRDDDRAGVPRVKYSPSQMKQVMDAWGGDDTSEDDEGDCDEEQKGNTGADGSRHEHQKYLRWLHKSHSQLKQVRSPLSFDEPCQQRYDSTTNPSYSMDSHNRVQGDCSFTVNVMEKNDNDPYNEGISLLQSAKNWLQSQRERLHRLELERQVEDQRRKLVEEGRKQRALEAERKLRQDGDHSSHASSYSRRLSNFSNEDSYIGHDILDIHNISSLCGLGSLEDDDAEYTGIARVDSSGRIIDIIPDEFYDDMNDDCLKVSSPRKTVSGEGMSVNVDIPINDVVCNSDTHRTQTNQTKKDNVSDLDDVKVVPEPVEDETSVTPPILTHSQMKSLIASEGLPPSLNYCQWRRLYCLERDGDSFDTFLHLVDGHDRTVLVVQTTKGQIFGGYADTKWEARGMHRQAYEFYGSAQACLFRFDNDEVAVYKWSGENRYIQLCDATRRTVAFGGGGDEGVFGLCIEDDFRRGTTGHCSTFENDALCADGYFDVMNLEVWGFILDF